MADLKPVGSEKLQGDEKMKRILELTYYGNNKKSSASKPELVKESKAGGVYGIVKEKDGYYVKRGLNESSLDYIGGMFMKNKNKFSSYAEAFKRLELIKGQDELNEATKYVLKPSKPEVELPEQDMPPAPAPAPAPAAPAAPAPAPDMGDMGDAPDGPDTADSVGSGDEEGKRSSYMAEVQKYAGKLGQELRDQHQKMESDDIKYVLNMIISAVDLDKLEDEDIEEIGKKFERDEEGAEGGEEPTDEEPAAEPEVAPDAPDQEMEEGMGALEEFINSGAPAHHNETSLSNHMGEGDKTEYIDLEEIKKALGNTLSKYFK